MGQVLASSFELRFEHCLLCVVHSFVCAISLPHQRDLHALGHSAGGREQFDTFQKHPRQSDMQSHGYNKQHIRKGRQDSPAATTDDCIT